MRNSVKGFIVETGHDYDCKNAEFVITKDDAINIVHDFFLSYDFEIRGGKPFDEGNDDGKDGGFKVFGDIRDWKVIDHNGELKVVEFTHSYGEGPVGSYRKN